MLRTQQPHTKPPVRPSVLSSPVPLASHSPGTQEGQQPLLLQVLLFPPLSRASQACHAAPAHQELPAMPGGRLGSQTVCGSCSPSPLSHSITQHAAPTPHGAVPHSPAALGAPEDPALLLSPETRETPSRLQQSQKPCPGHPQHAAAGQTARRWGWGTRCQCHWYCMPCTAGCCMECIVLYRMAHVAGYCIVCIA